MNSLLDLAPWIVVGIAAFLLIVPPGVRVIRQFERGLIFRFGRFTGTREPGL
jgi:regulator of protease activity HflC (stomatin/prohibitin superfamily)